MRKLTFKINSDDDFQLEGSHITQDLIFIGQSDQIVLEKLQVFIQDKIRKIVVLGSSAYNGKIIKSYRGSRIVEIEKYLSKIYQAAGELKTEYSINAGNWSFKYKIQ